MTGVILCKNRNSKCTYVVNNCINVYETYIETKKSEEFISLVYNWKSEFEKFAPPLNVSMVVGTAEERKQVK